METTTLLPVNPPPSVHAEHRGAPAGAADPGARGVFDALPAAPLLAALDLVALGVALVDGAARVVYANAAARSLLAASGWEIVGAQLLHADPAEQAAWRQAVTNAQLRDQRQLFDIGPRGDRRQAAIVPIAPLSADGPRWACVVVGRDEVCGPLELQMFAARHSLTYAECEVLRKLSLGCRAADIAQAHGVALSTVLTQVAALRSKTLVTSVRDLLATLARLPPLRSAYAWRLRR